MGVPGTIGDVRPFAEIASRPDTVVYKAYQQSLDRVVLLKVLRTTEGEGSDLLRRFSESARLVARIQHANVVAVYDYGEVGGQAYVITEFVDGVDLGSLLERGPLPLPLALFVLGELAAGLDAAHRKGVLHRDVKPENVLISEEGAVKLADFGLASLAHDDVDRSEVRGTLCYLSPEQIRGLPADARSDLFSLGATFVETLLGRRAFPGESAGETMDAVLHFDPVPLLDRSRIPEPTCAVAARLLAKDPDQRFASAADLLSELAGLTAAGVPTGSAVLLRCYLNGENVAGDGGMAALAGTMRAEAASITANSLFTPPPFSMESAHDEGAGSSTALSSASAEPPLTVAPDVQRRPGMRRLTLVLLALGVLVGSMALYVLSRDTATGGEETAAQLVDAGSVPRAESADETLQAETLLVESQSPDASGATTASLDPRQEDSQPVPAVRAAEGNEQTVDSAAVIEADPVTVSPAGLRIAVDPWAAVYVDGNLHGTGPAHDTVLEPGSHELRLEHPAFPALERTVVLDPGAAEQIAISFWDTVARVSLRADHWAEVEIDGRSAGTLPRLDPFLLPAGRHVVTLRNPDLGIQQDTVIVVSAGDEMTLRIDLSGTR